MRWLAEHTLSVVLGCCLMAGTVTAGATAPLAAGAEPVEEETWQTVWHPAFTPRMGAARGMQQVYRVGDRFAVVGGDDRGAVVWWSDDGIEWDRTKRSVATDHGDGWTIAGGPGGYVLGGMQWSPTPRGRIWYSPDGFRWSSAATKLPPFAEVRSVALLGDDTFVAYGYNGRREGCWMGLSTDDGETWDLHWEGDWDPGRPGGCATSVVGDESGLLGRINLGGISESTDGIEWREIVSADAIRAARPKSTKRYSDFGLVPLDDGRYLLGGKGKRALVWSREGGLQRIDSPVDVTGRRGLSLAFGPTGAVAVRPNINAPLLSPPAEAYIDRWPRRQPQCRPIKPDLGHIIAMRPSERLKCYGGRELNFEAWIPHSEYGGVCPFGAPYDWIVCENYWMSSGPGPHPGNLNYGLAPRATLAGGLHPASWGQHVRVTGHFDDPASLQCPEPQWNGKPPEGWGNPTRTDFIDDCRKQFIVTEMRRIRD